MAISDHWTRVAKQRARIVEVDTSQNIIDGITNAGPVRINVWEVPAGFRWPQVNEDWSIYEENGYWYLGHRAHDPTDTQAIMDMDPGAMRLDSSDIVNADGEQLALFSDIPTTLPPNGSAGGGLAGSYPNPTIAANAVSTTAILNAAVTLAKLFDRVEYGWIESNGAKISGTTGWTSSGSAGSYSVTFTPTFGTYPAVLVNLAANGPSVASGARASFIQPATFSCETYNPGVLVASAWAFIAFGQR